DAGHSLSADILEIVDIHLVRLPASDDSLDGGVFRNPLNNDGRNGLGKDSHIFVREGVVQHRQMHMNAGGARSFRICPKPELTEYLVQNDRNLLYVIERSFNRVEIEDEIVGIIQVLNARHPRVVLNVPHIRDVQELLAIGADEISNVPLNIL